MTTTKLTEKQQEGLNIAVNRYKTGERYTVIAGWAGTGKTFLAKQIIDALGLTDEEFIVGSFTGKASYRLLEGGFQNAMTLHKLRYSTVKIGNKFHHKKKDKSEFAGKKLILIDEISMVSEGLLKDISELGIHTIMMGDPFQLPPIGRDNGMLRNPHIILDEIMRQEEGSEIIELASRIRLGEKIVPFTGKEVKIISKPELEVEKLWWADQIICGFNSTRKKFNGVVRTHLGYSGLPKQGDKIIVTSNNWDMVNDSGSPLINGMIGEVVSASGIFKADQRMGAMIGKKIELARITFTPEIGGSDFTIKYDTLPLTSEKEETSYVMDQFAKGERRINYIDYGYCITTHKSQGSEYEKVLGIEEILNNKNHRRWLYTMVTRASKELILVYDENSPIWDFSS